MTAVSPLLSRRTPSSATRDTARTMASPAEQSLARRLVHTLKSERDAAFALVSEWVTGASAARGGRAEMLKVWKALFYTVWMSDGPLVQGELCLSLAGLLRRLAAPASRAVAVDFVGAFFETLQREWIGLDRFRVDKFMGLTRRIVYETFVFVRATGHEPRVRAALLGELERAMIAPPSGFASHVVDVFVDELMASGAGDSGVRTTAMLQPLIALLARGEERLVVAHAARTVFEDVLPALVVARGAAAAPPTAPAAPQPPSFKMRGLPPEARVEKHAAELAVLVADRDERARQSLCVIDAAAVARALFAVGADARTRPANRDLAYDAHKRFAALAIKVGDAASEKDTFPAEGAASSAPEKKKKKSRPRDDDDAPSEPAAAPVAAKERSGGKKKRVVT